MNKILQALADFNKPRFYVIGYYTQNTKAKGNSKDKERELKQTPILSAVEKDAFLYGAAMLELDAYVKVEGPKEQVDALLAL